ncbi:MAG: 2OG-Fe(II) oxygenase [Candidatus Cyclobacteriaceae bacterium M2_1C_046]
MTPELVGKYEYIIQGIIEKEYGVLDNFLEEKDVLRLRQDLLLKQEQQLFRRAGIGKDENYQKDKEIRGDNILWLNEKEPETQPFFKAIHEFIEYLNYTCYAGIRSSEFHYAVYPPGTYYERHLDTFINDDSRRFSIIFYLNDPDWQENDGGILRIYHDEKEVDILPKRNRLVCFASNKLEHEVLPTRRDRLSITGWLRNRLRPGGMYLFDDPV